jgi:hypothetical protein
MLARSIVSSALAVGIALFALRANAADVEYEIYVNGVRSATHVISAGWHTLSVKGRVTNNEIVSGVDGGFIQSAFDCADSADAVVWDEAGTSGTWNSTANAAFDSHFPGTLVDSDTEFIDETGFISPGDWNTDYDAVGAATFDFIASGDFYWNGETTTLELSAITEEILVATLNGANIGAKFPDSVSGDSTVLEAP